MYVITVVHNVSGKTSGIENFGPYETPHEAQDDADLLVMMNHSVRQYAWERGTTDDDGYLWRVIIRDTEPELTNCETFYTVRELTQVSQRWVMDNLRRVP